MAPQARSGLDAATMQHASAKTSHAHLPSHVLYQPHPQDMAVASVGGVGFMPDYNWFRRRSLPSVQAPCTPFGGPRLPIPSVRACAQQTHRLLSVPCTHANRACPRASVQRATPAPPTPNPYQPTHPQPHTPKHAQKHLHTHTRTHTQKQMHTCRSRHTQTRRRCLL